jgi:hypothetical protein
VTVKKAVPLLSVVIALAGEKLALPPWGVMVTVLPPTEWPAASRRETWTPACVLPLAAAPDPDF